MLGLLCLSTGCVKGKTAVCRCRQTDAMIYCDMSQYSTEPDLPPALCCC